MLTPARTIELAAFYLLSQLEKYEDPLWSNICLEITIAICLGTSRVDCDAINPLLDAYEVNPDTINQEGFAGELKKDSVGIALRHAAAQLTVQGLTQLDNSDRDEWNERQPLDDEDFFLDLTETGRAWIAGEKFQLKFFDGMWPSEEG